MFLFDSVVVSALSDPYFVGWDRELNLDIEFCVQMDICRVKNLSRMTEIERESAGGGGHSKRWRDCSGGVIKGWPEVLPHATWGCPSCFLGCFQYGNISPNPLKWF